METSIVPSLSLLQDCGNLRWIDRRDHVAVDDLQFPASGLVRDCGYLSLDNFAAIEADSDAGAYAVVHKSNYTRRRGRDCSALGCSSREQCMMRFDNALGEIQTNTR